MTLSRVQPYSKEEPYFNVLSRQCNFWDSTIQLQRFLQSPTLIIGVGKLYYADKWIFSKIVLQCYFSNPLVPYAWESISEEQERNVLYI